MQLSIATLEEQRQRDHLTHDAWGEKLTPAEFVTREERLRAHAWPRADLTTWLLRDDDGAVLASCETYRMRSFFDGGVGESFGIASVYTEPRLRGRGYATRLMDLVLARVRAQQPAAHAMLLFSDVGAPLYERSGYRARPAEDLIFPSLPGEIAADQLYDEAAVLELMATLPPPRDERFIVWPTPAQLDWHLERARIYGELLARPLPPHAGARIGESLIVWQANWKTERLVILLLEAARIDEARALVAAAQRAAQTAGLRDVVLWIEPWSFAVEALGGTRVARADSLPMIAPLQPSLQPELWRRVPRAIWM